MTTSPKDRMDNIPAEQIKIQPDFNPRRFFDSTEFQELVSSVQENGIIQPIVVRPINGKTNEYWVVAGERRFRAANEAKLSTIPVVIKELTNAEALLFATLENTLRANMSPAEEAQAARQILTSCNNDKSEALKLLGWNQKKFESRLLLLHAAPEVLDALTERQIKLGHAELLSQLPLVIQTATLESIISQGFSVADLKGKLAAFSVELSNACFDTADCSACPHNSALQASVFDDHIDSGKCANSTCYQQKTQTEMERRKALLADQYPVVFMDIERTPSSFKIVCKQGDEGVGARQLEQGCKQCAHFGALMKTSPDHIGQVVEDCCFNLECHTNKVAEYNAALMVDTKTEQTPRKSKKKALPEGKENNGLVEGNSSTSVKDDDAVKVSASAPPARVVEKIELFYRQLAAERSVHDKFTTLCLNTFGMYRLVKGSMPLELLPENLRGKGRYGFELDEFIKSFAPLGADALLDFNELLRKHLLGEHEKSMPQTNKVWANGAVSVLAVSGVDLTQYFILDKEFLNGFTKSGIEGVLRECVNSQGGRFVDFYEKAGKKNNFSGLMKKKSTEILDAVFSCGYDFSGFVPSCVSALMGENTITPNQTKP